RLARQPRPRSAKKEGTRASLSSRVVDEQFEGGLRGRGERATTAAHACLSVRHGPTGLMLPLTMDAVAAGPHSRFRHCTARVVASPFWLKPCRVCPDAKSP